MSGTLGDRHPDLTATLDEMSGMGPRIAFQDKKDEDQESHTLEESISIVAIGGSGYGYEPTGKCSGSTLSGPMLM